MNTSKSFVTIIIAILTLLVITLGYTFLKIDDLEQRISKLEYEIENPKVRIIPAD